MGELGAIGEVISSNKGKVNLHELEQRFGSRLTSKMLRKYEISNHKFLRKFAALQKRYVFPHAGISGAKGLSPAGRGPKTSANSSYGSVFYSVTEPSRITTNSYLACEIDPPGLDNSFSGLLQQGPPPAQIRNAPDPEERVPRALGPTRGVHPPGRRQVLLLPLSEGKLGQWN